MDFSDGPIPQLSPDDDSRNYPESTLDKQRSHVTGRTHPQHWCGQHNFDLNSQKNFYEYTNAEDKQKSAMCKIAEIARYNKIRHVYDLQDESGPAHRKLFTVKLILTTEEMFEGSGTSIKRAQQASAQNALQKTKLPFPTKPPARKKRNDARRPDRILQDVCRSLQYTTPHYVICNPPVYPDPGCPVPEHILIPTSASVLYGPQVSKSPINPTRPLGPKLQVVIVNINGKSIATGIGESYPLAKQDAAAKAMVVLNPIIEERQNLTSQVAHEDFQKTECVPKHKQKSVISYIHEKAHHLKMNVIFEVLREEGPPHDRQYVVRCAFVTVNGTMKAEALGKGKKKKTAQQEACSKLLEVVGSLESENNSIALANNVCRIQKKMAALNREPKRKTIVKDKKMDPSYGHQINPVSRLIQIMQTKSKKHPSFELVAENGLSKYKEFIIRVTSGENICEGKGPNKRLAKRAAAEAMLECIGYVQPSPIPGKSLLKKFPEASSQDTLSNENSESNFSTIVKNAEQELTPLTDEQGLFKQISYEKQVVLDSEKRRVTFNSQVHACPPPGDDNYPNSIITSLKKDAVVEGKIRRLKRTKENRRALTSDQIASISNCAHNFLLMAEKSEKATEELSAYHQLDQISNEFKFGVQYTTFPEAGPSQHFTIVSLGLEEPLVGHGTGATNLEADENAALAALLKLKDLKN